MLFSSQFWHGLAKIAAEEDFNSKTVDGRAKSEIIEMFLALAKIEINK